MPTPVQTQILDTIGSRLQNISVANGYFNDLEKLERARLVPFKNQDMPSINYYTTGDILDTPMNTGVVQRIMTVITEFYAVNRDRPFLDVSNELMTDILIALDRDPAFPTVADQDSGRLGKTVVGLQVNTATPAIGEGQNPYCGIIMVIDISYRVSRQDPFTLIT